MVIDKFGHMKIIIVLFFVFMFFTAQAFAESSYVLPYPSAMPGSIFYKLNLIQDEILKFWYFGNFGRFKYDLSQSDKYLVEARILFDYRQHLLAYQALQKSDSYFKKIEPVILSAKKNGKDTIDKEVVLKEASGKHIEELTKLQRALPPTLEWRPEKQRPIILNLREAFETAIKIRQGAL